MFACLTFMAGILCTACFEDTGDKTITVAESSGLVDVRLKIGQEYLQGEEGKYTVAYQSNVAVELYAKEYGVDFTDVVIKVGERELNLEDSLIDTKYYNPIPTVGDLKFGSFKMPYIESDTVVTIYGVKTMESKFTLQGKNLQDSAVVNKLKATKISLATGEDKDSDYVNLYNLLNGTAENRTFERTFDENSETVLNTYRTFKLKFEGVSPFNIEQVKPFKIKKSGSETEMDIDSCTLIDEIYYVDLGYLTVGDSRNYTVVVDFSNVEYQEFDINLPAKNATYEMTCTVNTTEDKETINFNESAKITFTKKMSSEAVEGEIYANYDEMQMLLNGTPLQKVKDGEYLIPEKMTPHKTLLGGEDYNITVNGIKYFTKQDGVEQEVETIKLNAQGFQLSNLANSVTPKFFQINENGEKVDVAGVGENGSILAFVGQKYAMTWGYEVDNLLNTYRSRYDLYNYDIMLGEGKVLKVSEALKSAWEQVPQEEPSEPFVFESEDVNGFVLKATYNFQQKQFDKFELEFVCKPYTFKIETEAPEQPDEGEGEGGTVEEGPILVDVTYDKSLDFSFANFVFHEKNINVVRGFDESDRIQKVEFAVFSGEFQTSEWRELSEMNSRLTQAVIADSMICIKITTGLDVTIDTYAYKVENEVISSTTQSSEVYVENNRNVTILKFVVSDVYYDSNSANMEFKIVKDFDL